MQPGQLQERDRESGGWEKEGWGEIEKGRGEGVGQGTLSWSQGDYVISPWAVLDFRALINKSAINCFSRLSTATGFF